MRTVVFLIALALISSLLACASPQMMFKPAQPGLTHGHFLEAKEACSAANRAAGWFYYGPAVFVPLVVAVGESAKERARVGFMRCMEASGWRCDQNCPEPSALQDVPLPAQNVQLPPPATLDVAVLAERVRAERAKQWIWFGNGTTGNLYYDPDSVGLWKNSNPLVREQIAFAADYPNLSYRWSSAEIDCNNKAVRFTDLVAVDKAGNPTDPRMKEGQWIAVPEKAAMRVVIDRVCTGPEQP